MTQEDFAKALEVTTAMQKSYESGKAKPSIVYIEKLSKMVGMTPSEFSAKEVSILEIVKKVENIDLGTPEDFQNFILNEFDAEYLNKRDKQFLVNENEDLKRQISQLNKRIELLEKIIALHESGKQSKASA